MSLTQYVTGVVLLVLSIGPLCAGAVRVRRRVMPGCPAEIARLAEIVMVLGLLTAVAQLLGALGAFKQAPLVVGSAAVGTAAFALAGPGRAREPQPRLRPERGLDWLQIGAVMAACAVLIGQWGSGVEDVLRHGVASGDTLSYHGPISARFAQTGHTMNLEFVYGDPIVPFLPGNSELLHAVGMLFFRSDVLSPLINLAWLAVALLAVWCIGRQYNVQAASVVAAGLVLGSRTLVSTQAGTQYNDIMVAALLAAAAALLVTARGQLGPVLVAGVAAGLTVGTKVTAIAPVAALTIGIVLLTPRAQRTRVLVGWGAAFALLAAPWYLRNLVQVGNPLPGLPDLGPVALPSPPLPVEFSVAHYVHDRDLWGSFFFPQLHKYFGPAWPVTLALALAGMTLAMLKGATRAERLLGGSAIVMVIAWFVSPRSGGNVESVPAFFPTTLRYVTPALVLGLALAALQPAVRRIPMPGLLAGLGALLLVTVPYRDSATVGRTLAVGTALGVVALVATAGPLALGPRVALGGAVACLVATLGAGWWVADHYLDAAYADPVSARVRGVEGTKIAAVGELGTYSLFGRDLSNHVETIGLHGPDGAFLPVPDCRFWREALNRGHYAHVVTSPRFVFGTAKRLELGSYFGTAEPEADWTRSDPAAAEEAADPARAVVMFRVEGRFDPGKCEAPKP